jgi:hypothetical protein
MLILNFCFFKSKDSDEHFCLNDSNSVSYFSDFETLFNGFSALYGVALGLGTIVSVYRGTFVFVTVPLIVSRLTLVSIVSF